jgi:hypothetical protein
MRNDQKAEQRFKNVILKGRYKTNRELRGQHPSENNFFSRVQNNSFVLNAMQIFNSYGLINEFFNSASTNDYLLNIAFSDTFKNTFSSVLSPGSYNNLMSLRGATSFFGGNVSMLPTSGMYNTFSSSLLKKEMQVKNLIHAVKNRLSIRKIHINQKNKKEEYVIDFKPFKGSKYFEAINNFVKEMVVDMNMNFEISKSESAAKFFDRYLEESNRAYLPSVIGQTLKLTSCTTSVLKGAFGCKNSSSVLPPEVIIKYSDNRSKLLLAIEKGMAQLANTRL